MSDHLDGLTAAARPKLDITDVYLFNGQDGTVMVMNTNNGAADGWDTDALYEFKLDINGDAREDIAFRLQFSGHSHPERGLHTGQRLTLSAHLGAGARDPESNGFTLVSNGATERVHSHWLTGVRAWAGRAGDPFYTAGPVVGAVRASLTEGTPLDLSGFDPDQATNLFGDTNVNAVVIELPNLLGLLNGLDVGFWGTVTLPTDDGGWRQVDRAAIPFTSTIFGFNAADDYNATHPADDDERWGPTIERLTRAAAEANGMTVSATKHAQRVRERLTPDILPYRIGSPARLSGGEWNGRNLTEDASEAAFEFALDTLIDTGLSAADATGQLRDEFPYLAEPVSA